MWVSPLWRKFDLRKLFSRFNRISTIFLRDPVWLKQKSNASKRVEIPGIPNDQPRRAVTQSKVVELNQRLKHFRRINGQTTSLLFFAVLVGIADWQKQDLVKTSSYKTIDYHQRHRINLVTAGQRRIPSKPVNLFRINNSSVG